MVQLYKRSNGRWVFVDYGVVNRIREYELMGFHVCVVKSLPYRPVIHKRGEIFCTHNLHKKQWTMREQIAGVIKDVKTVFRAVKSIFIPVQAWELQLARA